MNDKHMKIGTARQLSASEKVQIILWISQNKELCESKSAEELAGLYKEKTGINVSNSTVLTYRREVFPEIRNKKKNIHGGAHNGGIMSHRIKALESSFSDLVKWAIENGYKTV